MDEKKRKSEKSTEPQKERICENLSFAAKEAFKRLRTNVNMSFSEKEDKCRQDASENPAGMGQAGSRAQK